MPPPRLLPPQFLRPAWTTRQIRQASGLHHSARKSQPKKPPKAPSPNPVSPLLEELFPEEAKKRRAAEQQKAEREIPRLVLDPRDIHPVEAPRRRRETHRNRIQREFDAKGDQTTVLVLRHASKSLVEDDFRRVMPKGKHIEEWSSKGEFLKIIPGRNPYTLERQNHYFLIFRSSGAARIYQDRVSRLHKLSKMHVPTSLTSPIPPPPGYLIQGEDVHALLQAFSLIPPSQTLDMRILVRPYSPNVQKLLDHGGYKELVAREGKQEHKVLLDLDGPQPTPLTMKSTIAADAKERGISWALSDGDQAIQKLELKKESTVRNVEDQTVQMSEAEEDGVVQSEESDKDLEMNEVDRRAKDMVRWVVAFQSDAEAKRFVRSWHRRPFPRHKDFYEHGEQSPIVNAELVW